MNNTKLTLDQLADINGGIVDFGGSQFKVSTTVREKGWWTVDGANFKSEQRMRAAIALEETMPEALRAAYAEGRPKRSRS